MTQINRENIYNILKNSTWSESGVRETLKEYIYNDAATWHKFLRLFFISLGICFTAAGIIFFFAYNWADMHKFVKLGILEGLVIITSLLALFSKANNSIKNIFLTGASLMVGALFAVFGQIYQTGANAFDFFLGWTIFITLWVMVANFPVLWLLYILLINISVLAYADQVALNWSELWVFLLLFIVNSVFLILFTWLPRKFLLLKSPDWFLNIIALAMICLATIGIINGIFSHYEVSFLLLILATAVFYAFGIYEAMKGKKLFYIAAIPFSLIIIISALLIKISNDSAMFLIICFFIIISVTFVIKNLIDINKKWQHE